MAQIRIERKGHPYWPWVLGALALIAILILAVAWLRAPRHTSIDSPTALAPASRDVDANGVMPPSSADSTTDATASASSESAPGSAALQSYLAFAQSAADMDLAHDYTSNGLRRLAAALEAFPQAKTSSVRSRIDALRAQADRLQRDPASLRHADVARSAFVDAADILSGMVAGDQMPVDRDAGVVTSAPRRAAESIRADRPLTEQGAQVEAFFEASATALRALSEAG